MEVGVCDKLRSWQQAPWREEDGKYACDRGAALPDSGASQLRKAAATFSDRTGWGVDNIGPRQFMWLSDDLLDMVGKLLMAIEATGIWPRQLREALIHLIPKPTGGRRPIGLLASLLRILDKVRRPTLVHWRTSNERSYNWMAPGKGAARAIWAQSVQEEAACFEGKKSAAVLVDLVKAFEQVTLGPVWHEGIRTHFHPRMLRLALELCTVGRRLVYKKAASRNTAHTLTAILAGLGVASDLMLLKLMKPVDTVIAEIPRAKCICHSR